MGSNSSRIVRKIFAPNSHCKNGRKNNDIPSSSFIDDRSTVKFSTIVKLPPHVGPLVLYRQGSMFFDEDGDLAHEFYVEVKKGRKSAMKRVNEHLKPQGIIKLPFPRLHNDCPVVMYAL